MRTYTKLADIFIRLNSGKPLNDNDMFWAQKDTPIVKLALKIVSDYHNEFLNIFDFDFSKPKELKGIFKHICGLVIGLANNDASMMTTAYAVNYDNLDFEEGVPYEENARAGLGIIFDLFRHSFGGKEIGKSQKKKFLKLGTLIPFFFKEYTDSPEEDKMKIFHKWMEIIVYILENEDGIQLLKTPGAQNLNARKIATTLERVQRWWDGGVILGVPPRMLAN